VQVADAGGGMPLGMIDLPGAQGLQMQNMQEMLGKMFGGRTKPRKMSVAEARIALVREEADKLLDQEQLTREAVANAENNGIVFLDEIDKICARSGEGGVRGGDVSREGVQRDLLPLIEGTTVTPSTGR
jgi:ATP-dependent HslUV protease ATP-binding subunit HslU